jgi:hypothetical protein
LLLQHPYLTPTAEVGLPLFSIPLSTAVCISVNLRKICIRYRTILQSIDEVHIAVGLEAIVELEAVVGLHPAATS